MAEGDILRRLNAFAASLAKAGIRHTSQLGKTADRLTTDHLEWFVGLLAHNRLSRGDQLSLDFMTFGIATEVLRFFLGDDWTNGNVFGCHTRVAREHREGRKHLKAEHLGTDLGSGLRHQERVTFLAECLYNLQDAPGARHRMTLLQIEDLESALGEFRCAKLVAAPQFQLRFIVPTSQKKGMNYEAEVIAPGGRVVHCEVKTKKEDTRLSERTVYNTLENARKQLPKGKPGIVFLNIPEEWTKQRESAQAVDAAIGKVTRQSDRLVATVLVFEEWAAVGDAHAVISRFKPILNRRSSLFADDVEQLFALAGSSKNPNWLDFQDFLAKALPAIALELTDLGDG